MGTQRFPKHVQTFPFLWGVQSHVPQVNSLPVILLPQWVWSPTTTMGPCTPFGEQPEILNAWVLHDPAPPLGSVEWDLAD